DFVLKRARRTASTTFESLLLNNGTSLAMADSPLSLLNAVMAAAFTFGFVSLIARVIAGTAATVPDWPRNANTSAFTAGVPDARILVRAGVVFSRFNLPSDASALALNFAFALCTAWVSSFKTASPLTAASTLNAAALVCSCLVVLAAAYRLLADFSANAGSFSARRVRY